MPCRWYQTPMTKGFLGFIWHINHSEGGHGHGWKWSPLCPTSCTYDEKIENANWNTWASGGTHCRISSYFTCSLTISLSMWPSNCRIVKTRAAVSCAWFEAKNGLNVRRRRSQISDNIRRICIWHGQTVDKPNEIKKCLRFSPYIFCPSSLNWQL